jgi:hypothetical protein
MKGVKSRIISYLESLRFPALLVVTAIFVPDVIPFVDEILMALVVALLSRIKRRPEKTENSGSE